MTRLLFTLGLAGSVGLSIGPFLWFFLTSLKSQGDIEAVPPTWWPSGSLTSYRSVLVDHHLFDYVANSVVVAGSTTVLALVIAIPAAYASARPVEG